MTPPARENKEVREGVVRDTGGVSGVLRMEMVQELSDSQCLCVAHDKARIPSSD